jgi:hypothetical protein
MPLLADLLSIPDRDTIFNSIVLPAMRGRGLNVTAWGPLDPWRILSRGIATLYEALKTGQAAWAAAGFGEYVFGAQQPPGEQDVTPWASLRSRSWYGVEPIGAKWSGGSGGTYMKRKITLTNTSGSAYGPLAQGTMRLRFPTTGNRYVQDDDNVTIPANASIDVVFRSEFPVDTAAGYSYGDLAGASIKFVTADYPGVTATNPAPTYSDVAQVGSCLGTLTLTGSPVGNHSIAVRIDSTGQSGAATWSTSLDGAAYVSHGSAASITNLGGVGINIALTNGAATPSFLQDAVFYFATPGSDVTVAGRDAETPEEIGARCYAIWPSLAFVKDSDGNWIPRAPVMSAIEALTRTASDQVKVCLVRLGAVNDEIKVVVAAQGGLLPVGTIALLQHFWDVMAGTAEEFIIASPSTQAITLGGASVIVKAGQIASAKREAQRRVFNYLTGVDPANPLPIGDGSTVKVQRSCIVSLIRSTPGVTAMTDGDLTINGVAADFVLPLDTLSTYSGDVATLLAWGVS